MEVILLILMLNNAKVNKTQNNYIKENYIMTKADNTNVYLTKGDENFDIVNIVTSNGGKYTYAVEKLK